MQGLGSQIQHWISYVRLCNNSSILWVGESSGYISSLLNHLNSSIDLWLKQLLLLSEAPLLSPLSGSKSLLHGFQA